MGVSRFRRRFDLAGAFPRIAIADIIPDGFVKQQNILIALRPEDFNWARLIYQDMFA